jgi:hypothetical protein
VKNGSAAKNVEKEKAAICVVQKNEDWYLQEWFDYHLAWGFDDIYIFNHGRANITPTNQIHVLPVEEKFSGDHMQHELYNLCLEIIKRRKQPQHGAHNTTWVAFFDVDEFLMLKKHTSVQDFMADHCPAGLCGSVGINWLWFGTANQTYYDPKPVTQRFVYRDYQPIKIIKSIARVDDFYCIDNAHFPHLISDPTKDRYQPPFSYDTNGTILWAPILIIGFKMWPYCTTTPTASKFRLN